MCHQLQGEGGKVGPDLSLEGTRGRTNEWLVSRIRNPQADTPGSVMPPFKNLTDEQVQALVAFLQSQKAGK
jgi:cytochrome c1